MRRKIVQIDEQRCDGCGQCIPACAEGAISLVDGKARLSADVLCDGLGACLGECPQGAITVIERDAAAFDEEAVRAHLARTTDPAPAAPARASLRVLDAPAAPAGGGCPGARPMALTRPPAAAGAPALAPAAAASRLAHWPVQLHLVPVKAPWFDGADVLVAADCVPFAHPRFHEDLLAGKALVIGCPKLDDLPAYVEKLTRIFAANAVRSVTVVRMEVPCCGGMAAAARRSLAAAGKELPLRDVVVRVDGGIRE